MIFHRKSGREVEIMGYDPSSGAFSVKIVPVDRQSRDLANKEMLVYVADLKADGGMRELNDEVARLEREREEGANNGA